MKKGAVYSTNKYLHVVIYYNAIVAVYLLDVVLVTQAQDQNQ